MPKTRILPADLKLSSSLSALDDVGEKTLYHLALGADDDTNDEGVGIAFSRSTVQSNVGAAIIFERTDTGSKGELHFYTKTDTGAGVSPVKALSVTSDSEVVQHVQPAFNTYRSSYQSNIADLGTIIFDTERFDVGSNYNTSTGVFTAPVTGKYLLTYSVDVSSLDKDASYYWLQLITSNRNYYGPFADVDVILSLDGRMTFQNTVVADMDASDTAYLRLDRSGGVTQADIVGAASSSYTWFHGYLLG